MARNAPTAELTAPPALLQPLPERDPGGANNLPAPLTTLIGRDREIAAAGTLLLRDEVRLVTCIGPGGVGKTQLALAVARTLSPDFADGVVFVPLAQIRDPALVASAIAHVLNVSDAGSRPLLAGLVSVLRQQHLLVVLDNFEHVMAAGPLVTELLTACPQVKVLATSRALLHVTGEHAFAVPPLALPEPARTMSLKALTNYDAIRLFSTRAQEVKPDFVLTEANASAVADICQRLNGLPLAIELAAARVHALAPPALLAQMTTMLPVLTEGHRDAPERLQTMRHAIAWSYDLLTRDEQTLFRHLAVFVGGFTLEAARAVMADRFVLDDLTSLVDKSLVQQEERPDGTTHFSLLETIREFGLEQLAASGDAATAGHRHAEYFTTLAEQAAPALTTAAAPPWVRRLDRELPNVRAALAWAAEQDANDLLLRLAVALWRFWEGHLSSAEGYDWLGRAVATSANLPPELNGKRALLLAATGRAATERGEVDRAAALLEESLALAQEIDDARAIAQAIENQALLAIQVADYARAETLIDETLRRWRALAEPARVYDVLYVAGYAAGGQGKNDQATAWFTASLDAARTAGDEVAVAHALEALGTHARLRGDLRRAASLIAESLKPVSDGLYPWNVEDCLESMGAVAAAAGLAEQAARLSGAAEALRDRAGGVLPEDHQLFLDHAVAPARAQLSADAFAAAWAAGRALTLDEAIAEVYQVADEILSKPSSGGATAAGLTARELEVLRLLVEGLANKEIGDRLGISRHTVAKHIAAIFAKLDVPSRTAAATYAARHDPV